VYREIFVPVDNSRIQIGGRPAIELSVSRRPHHRQPRLRRRLHDVASALETGLPPVPEPDEIKKQRKITTTDRKRFAAHRRQLLDQLGKRCEAGACGSRASCSKASTTKRS